MPTWSPDHYLKFEDQRTRPCRDLADRIRIDNVRTVIDLGCGPGNSTAVLEDHWPTAKITGLDTSVELLDRARGAKPQHEWIAGDIAQWSAGSNGKYDVVFSNAALQWVRDHAEVYPRLFARVAPGGALAIQVPINLNAPAHEIMRDLASSPA